MEGGWGCLGGSVCSVQGLGGSACSVQGLGVSACSVQGTPLGGLSVLRLCGQCVEEDPGKVEGEVE